MIPFNQNDINTRLQLIQCCIATKTSELLSKIKIGSSDVTCKLQELQVIQKMLKYLKNYQILQDEIEEVIATGTATVNQISIDNTIIIYVNGVNISGTVTSATNLEAFAATAIKNAINNYQSVYTATSDSTVVTISGGCCNYSITAITVGLGSDVSTTNLSGGICAEPEITEYDNCLTEEEMQKMFDYLSDKCSICFQSAEFPYQ